MRATLCIAIVAMVFAACSTSKPQQVQITEVRPLQHVAAHEIAAELQQSDLKASLAADARTNSIVIHGFEVDVQRALRAIEDADQPG